MKRRFDEISHRIAGNLVDLGSSDESHNSIRIVDIGARSMARFQL